MTLEERRIIWNKRKAMRREAAIRRLAVRAAIGFAFLLTVSNIIFFIAKPVKAKEEKAYIKYYTTIEIKQGDTLTSIAKEHLEGYSSVQDYIDEVKFMNGLKDANSIRAGQKIHIPYYSTEIKM